MARPETSNARKVSAMAASWLETPETIKRASAFQRCLSDNGLRRGSIEKPLLDLIPELDSPRSPTSNGVSTHSFISPLARPVVRCISQQTEDVKPPLRPYARFLVRLQVAKMHITLSMVVAFLLVAQICFIIGFAALGHYSATGTPANSSETAPEPNLLHFYGMFQDVHVMIYIGFGFLMTFLKKYGYSAISINLLLAAFVVQWHTLLFGLFHLEKGKFMVGIVELTLGEFCAGAVLISMGAVLGKISPVQYLVMAIIETILFTCNEYIFEKLAVNDVGGSMNLHAFGAYFGLAVARVMHDPNTHGHSNEGSVYHSDLFSMIGTVFLWMYWPSFNAAVVGPEDARHRAVVNTYFALTACTLTAFAVSALVHEKHKFNMVHVQNATLAGGVAIGCSANLVVWPYGAMIVGMLAGGISVLGYKFLQPWLGNRYHLHDTCGVNNLHGMPGILGGIVSIVLVSMADMKTYKSTFYEVFPGMNTDPKFIAQNSHMVFPGRSVTMQVIVQAIGLGSSLGIGLVGGVITGYILKLSFFGRVEHVEHLFDDTPYFDTPDCSMEEEIEAVLITRPETPVRKPVTFPEQLKPTSKPMSPMDNGGFTVD